MTSLALANWCVLTMAPAPRRGERPACTCSRWRPLLSPHRCALSLLGEVSLAAEPLSSLSSPLPSMAWALQLGAVALVESWTLHTATSALIRAVPSVTGPPPAATPTAHDEATSTGTVSSSTDEAWVRVSNDFWVGFAAAAPPVPWRIADAWEKLLCALEVEKVLSTALVGCSSPAFLGLLMGRVAMVLITALALHADVQFGILHDVFSRGNLPLTARERRDERPVTRPGALAPFAPTTAPSAALGPKMDLERLAAPSWADGPEMDLERLAAEDSFSDSLASDLVLQDIPLELN